MMAGIDPSYGGDPFIGDGGPTSSVVDNILRDQYTAFATAMRNFYAASGQAAVKALMKANPDIPGPVKSLVNKLMDQAVQQLTGTDNPLFNPGNPVSLPTQIPSSSGTGNSGSGGDSSTNGGSQQPQSSSAPAVQTNTSDSAQGPAMQDASVDSTRSGDQSSGSSQSDGGSSMLP